MKRGEMTQGGYRTKGGGLVQAPGDAAFRLLPVFDGKRAEAAIDVQLVAGGFVVFRETVRCGSMKRRNETLAAWESMTPRLMSWRDGTITERVR